MLIPVDRWSLTLKKVGSEVFLQNQSINSFIPTSRMNLLCPIIKRKGFIMWILVSPIWKTNFNSKKGTKRSFFYETKASIRSSQWVKWIYGAQSLKERRLLCDFIFIPTKIRTLILKNVERKIFLLKSKHQFIYPNE